MQQNAILLALVQAQQKTIDKQMMQSKTLINAMTKKKTATGALKILWKNGP